MQTLLKEIQESTIDFPTEDLSSEIWKKVDDTYILRDDVEEQINAYVNSYPKADLSSLYGDLHVVGSIGTNLSHPTADIDVHINPDTDRLKEITDDPDVFQKEVKAWTTKNPVYIGEHPVEIYIQLRPEQDLFGDACYDVKSKQWLKGPTILPADYNPYEAYHDLFDRIQSYAKEADINLGELKRDIIDHKVLTNALQRLPAGSKEGLKVSLQQKVTELEDDIQELLKNKEEWVALRQTTSRPTTPEQALHDVELAKKWGDANAIFKFLDRYEYVKIITVLEEMLKDNKLDPKELDKIEDLLGVL